MSHNMKRMSPTPDTLNNARAEPLKLKTPQPIYLWGHRRRRPHGMQLEIPETSNPNLNKSECLRIRWILKKTGYEGHHFIEVQREEKCQKGRNSGSPSRHGIWRNLLGPPAHRSVPPSPWVKGNARTRCRLRAGAERRLDELKPPLVCCVVFFGHIPTF